jgi:hypothetical protein
VLLYPNWASTMGMATARAAWGADAMSLRGGASARVSAGWRSTTGGHWRRLVEEEGEGRGFCRVWPRAPLPSFDPTRYDKGRSLARFGAGL